jgi:ubiquinone/menaquinone biosynthesis C-methylase UbiE
MDYKQTTKEAYDEHAEAFEKATRICSDFLEPKMQFFINCLSGKKVLDLGCGPGRDALQFKQRGINSVCIDISPEMIRLCKQKGLDAYVMDIENMTFADNSFDGVWAVTSLLHFPKSSLDGLLVKVKRVLRQEGLFFISMKEGASEGFLRSAKYPGAKRFFALYHNSELRAALTKHFYIIDSYKEKLGDAFFLGYFCRT